MERSFKFLSRAFLVALLLTGICNGQIQNRYRLSGNSRPLHYDLRMRIDVDAQEFSGSVDITIDVANPTTTLDLHYKDMEVSNVQLTDNNQVFEHLNFAYEDETEILSLQYPQLSAGTYKLSMEFKAPIRTDLKGLYMSTYFDDQGEKRFIATTFMAPTYARMAFPCYDEPAYKANYTIHISHADKYFALSNMPEDQQTDLGGGWKTTHFKESKPTSTYIVAFIVCDFVKISDPEWPLSIYAQPAIVQDTSYALKHFNSVRAELEKYVGRSFQYPKLDMIAIDDFLMGAMENWGIITYLSSRIVINDATDLKTKISGSKTMSHEMAHQWFGNEVTHQYWNMVWLKEGLATLFEDLLTDAVHPEWRMWDQFVINTMQVVMQQDSAAGVRHMMKDYTTPAEIRAVYDFVTYKKAGSVMRMMMNVLTPAVFKRAMDVYIEENSFATSTNEKLASAWQKAVDESGRDLPNISTVFAHWTNVPGFPVVTVTRSGQSVNIHQRKFTSSHSTFGTESQEEFHIPLNYASEKNPDFTDTSPQLWLTTREDQFEMPASVTSDQWIIFNKQATGYYRVNYDNENWALISRALNEDPSRIAPANRAQLLDDALNLARYGQLDYAVALDLLGYLGNEIDFVPLTSALTNLRDLERLSRGSDLYLEGFFMEFVEKLYERYSFEAMPENEDDVSRLARVEVLNFACRFGQFNCTYEAFFAFSRNLEVDIDADVRPAIFCGSVQYRFDITNGSIAATMLSSRYNLKAATEGDRRRNDKEVTDIFNSISCIRSESILEEILQWTVKGKEGAFLEKGDPNKIFAAVANANITGTKVALEFLQRNFDIVKEKYESMPRVFEALSQNVVTQELKELFDKVVETHVDKEKADETTKSSLESAENLINENLKWKELRVDSVKEFLKGSGLRVLVSPVLIVLMLLATIKLF